MEFEPKDIRLFFREVLTKASERLRFSLESWIEFYLVDLLTRQATLSISLEPLVHQMIEAVEAPLPDRFNRWKSMGESALIQVGMFPERMKRSGVTHTYVFHMGVKAYSAAGALAQDGMGNVYFQVSENFQSFAYLLEAIRNQTSLKPRTNVLRLIESWEEGRSAEALHSLLGHDLYLVFDPDKSKN